MTDAAPTTAPRRSGGIFAMIGVGAVVLLGLLYFTRSEPPLERAATGMAGLVPWLKANDVNAWTFRGRLPLIRAQVGMRILPLYDTDLARDRDVPETPEEVIAQTAEYDLQIYVFNRKVAGLPTLVILPKWRSGVRALKVAHQSLLIPDDELDRLLGQIGVSGGIQRGANGWSTEQFSHGQTSATIGLLHRQTVSAGNCTPLVGTRDDMLLGDCKIRGRVGKGADAVTHFRLLTDPDLLSNHGLALAQNGAAAQAIFQAYNLKAPAVLDLTNEFLLLDKDPFAVDHERRLEDFLRLFEWPFTMIWLGFGVVAALILWRAVTRYGPLARVNEDEPQAAKTVSIDAKARLLRLANHDVALLKSHVRARLGDLVADLLGPHRKPGTEPLAVLLPIVDRAAPALAEELRTASDMSEPIGDVLGRLDRFENCHDRIRHEFGRTTVAG